MRRSSLEVEEVDIGKGVSIEESVDDNRKRKNLPSRKLWNDFFEEIFQGCESVSE